MNDSFIYEKLIHSRKRRAGVRVREGVKRITLDTMTFDNFDNAIVFDGDAVEADIKNIVIKNGVNPFYAHNLINSDIGNVEVIDAESLSRQRKYFREMLMIEKNQCYQADLMINHAMFLKTHLIFEESLEWSIKALNIYKNNNIQDRMSIAYGNIGVLFKNLNYIGKAYFSYILALKIDKKLGRLDGELTNRLNIGIVYDLNGQHGKATRVYEKCIKLANKNLDKELLPTYLSKIYQNLAISESHIDVDKAINYYEKSIAINIEIEDVYGLAISYRGLGLLYNKIGKISLSTKYVIKSAELFKSLDILREECETKNILQIEF